MTETTLTTTQGEGIVPHDFSVFPESLKGKRILLCTESFGPVNGVSRTTLMLVNHLRSHGALIAVVAPHNHTKHNTFVANKYSRSGSSSDEEEDSQIELRIHGYPLPFNPELSIVYPVRVSALIARTFGSDTPPDLIYLASPASLGFQIMLQMRQRPAERQIPIICNFQTDLAGYCAILFPRPLSDVAVYTFATVQSYLFRHKSVKTVLYPSRFVRRYLEAQGVQDDKLEVLRRGVNTELFHPDRRSEALRREIAPDGEIILICVSRIAGEKGFDFLARAAKLLHERGLRFKLYIVGGNRNAEVEREIQGLFEPLVEKGKVLFAGFQVGEDLAAAYASGDVFLHCSVTETFGLVVLESMASGVPVIARDEGGPSDIVHDGGSGYLVPPDDLEQFVRRVAEVVEDGELRARLGAESRRLACEATWDKINNKAAWKMADAIQERRGLYAGLRRRGGGAAHGGGGHGVLGWDVVGAKVVDARIGAGLLVILFFWALTGSYVLFTEACMWMRSLSGRVVSMARRRL